MLAAQLGCGGATPGADQPGAGASGAETAGESPSGVGPSVGPEAAADSCADGSCVSCGEGICPAGYFCNESASGGAGCGWVAECAESATCACVQQALGSGCECSERGGFAVVRCD